MGECVASGTEVCSGMTHTVPSGFKALRACMCVFQFHVAFVTSDHFTVMSGGLGKSFMWRDVFFLGGAQSGLVSG